MTDMPGPQLLRLGRKAQKCVDLALFVKLRRLDRGVDHPVDIAGRVKPDIGRHRRRIHVLARAQALHTDTLALQIGNTAHAFVAEQFEAADMHPRQ